MHVGLMHDEHPVKFVAGEHVTCGGVVSKQFTGSFEGSFLTPNRIGAWATSSSLTVVGTGPGQTGGTGTSAVCSAAMPPRITSVIDGRSAGVAEPCSGLQPATSRSAARAALVRSIACETSAASRSYERLMSIGPVECPPPPLASSDSTRTYRKRWPGRAAR